MAGEIDEVGACLVSSLPAASRGWARIPSPGASGSDLKVLFFVKDGRECSVLLIPAGAEQGTIAMVSATG